MPRHAFRFPREVLLVEIERRCRLADCEARNSIGLTRSEAIEYRGFECVKCQRWNEDSIDVAALPDSWADATLMNHDDQDSNN